MEQMLVWAFIHREFTRQERVRPRCDDAFYGREIHAGRSGRGLLGALWPRLKRGG